MKAKRKGMRGESCFTRMCRMPRVELAKRLAAASGKFGKAMQKLSIALSRMEAMKVFWNHLLKAKEDWWRDRTHGCPRCSLDCKSGRDPYEKPGYGAEKLA